MTEQWKDIPEYEGIYQISDKANVKSLDRVLSNGHKLLGQPIKSQMSKHGCSLIFLNKNNFQRCFSVGRIYAEVFLGEKLDKHKVISYKNSCSLTISRKNISIVTKKEKGREAARLSEHGGSCLTDSQKMELYLINKETGRSYRSLGRDFGVSYTTVSKYIKAYKEKHKE